MMKDKSYSLLSCIYVKRCFIQLNFPIKDKKDNRKMIKTRNVLRHNLHCRAVVIATV